MGYSVSLATLLLALLILSFFRWDVPLHTRPEQQWQRLGLGLPSKEWSDSRSNRQPCWLCGKKGWVVV